MRYKCMKQIFIRNVPSQFHLLMEQLFALIGLDKLLFDYKMLIYFLLDFVVIFASELFFTSPFILLTCCCLYLYFVSASVQLDRYWDVLLPKSYVASDECCKEQFVYLLSCFLPTSRGKFYKLLMELQFLVVLHKHIDHK